MNQNKIPSKWKWVSNELEKLRFFRSSVHAREIMISLKEEYGDDISTLYWIDWFPKLDNSLEDIMDVLSSTASCIGCIESSTRSKDKYFDCEICRFANHTSGNIFNHWKRNMIDCDYKDRLIFCKVDGLQINSLFQEFVLSFKRESEQSLYCSTEVQGKVGCYYRGDICPNDSWEVHHPHIVKCKDCQYRFPEKEDPEELKLEENELF